VPFADGTHRLLYAMESPESWFEDFGFGQLDNGVVEVRLEEIFQSVTSGDQYHVFLTEYGDDNGLYVTDRTGTGFTVRSKTPSAGSEFSYRIVARRGDIETQRFASVPMELVEKAVGDYEGVPAEAPEVD
jgi:hypothetical protein